MEMLIMITKKTAIGLLRHLQVNCRVLIITKRNNEYNYDEYCMVLKLKCSLLFLGKNVHLSFLTFEMEDEQDCGYDFIEIFSGFDDTGPSYGRFCGNKIPPEIISVDDALLLRYIS